VEKTLTFNSIISINDEPKRLRKSCKEPLNSELLSICILYSINHKHVINH